MTLDEIMVELEKRFGTLDERTKQAVTLALKLAEERALPEWRGENPTWDEWQRTPEEKRQELMDKLEEQNRIWLERMRQALRAKWLLVVDGQVVLHGESHEDFPRVEEIENLCHRLGKVPLWYELAPVIEESTAWQPTSYTNDAYPTIRVAFSNNEQRWETVADFETGALEIFTGAEFLEHQGLVTSSPSNLWRSAQHPGQPYRYTRIYLQVALEADDGTEKETNYPVLCVRNWQNSPFVVVNPNRRALVGRSLCLTLMPYVGLDFANRKTELRWG